MPDLEGGQVDYSTAPDIKPMPFGGTPRGVAHVPKQHDSKIDFEPVPAASLASMHRLPKTTAVASFEKKLLDDDIPNEMAAIIARAVVDPADARRRLARLTQIRVPGGIVYALETTVWATAAVPYVVNNREAS